MRQEILENQQIPFKFSFSEFLKGSRTSSNTIALMLNENDYVQINKSSRNSEDSDFLITQCPHCHKNSITIRFCENRVENCDTNEINPNFISLCDYCIYKISKTIKSLPIFK